MFRAAVKQRKKALSVLIGLVMVIQGIFGTSPDALAATWSNAVTFSTVLPWFGVTYGTPSGTPRFVAVSRRDGISSALNAMYSDDNGLNWTQVSIGTNTHQWWTVGYGNSTYVALAGQGTNRIATSSTGTSWTTFNSSTSGTYQWGDVIWDGSKFVAIACGTGSNVFGACSGTPAVMSSADGSSWTVTTGLPAGVWRELTYGGGRYVAVANSGSNRLMTSTDGTTWTTAGLSGVPNYDWYSVTYGNGLFVAIAPTGSGTKHIMTSPDGLTWTERDAPIDISWRKVAYGDGLFMVVANGDDDDRRAMYSNDGINWFLDSGLSKFTWNDIAYGNNAFVSVACGRTTAAACETSSSGIRAMTTQGAPAPSISSISPTTATTGAGNFTLTVNGADFMVNSKVRFNGSDRTTTYVSTSQLTATITASDISTSGSKNITVYNAVGNQTSGASTLSVNNASPTLTSISPTTASAGVGFTLTVNGTGYSSASIVRINGTNTTNSKTLVNSTQMTVVLTAAEIASVGTYNITVFNPTPGGGTSATQQLTVNYAGPTLASISPTSKTVGDAGFTLTANGSLFYSNSVVRFASSDRSTTFVNAGQLTASILAGDLLTAGIYAITVFTPTPGGGTSSAQNLTVNNPSPTTSSISPTSIEEDGADFTLTVNGSNFTTQSVVRINGSSRTTTYVSPTQITATITAADITTPGTKTITVFSPTPGGGTSGGQTLTITEAASNPVPVTTSISPDTKTAGSASFLLTVNGSDFVPDSVISIDAVDLATNYVGPTQLTATVSSSYLTTPGNREITVFNPAPDGGTSNAQILEVVEAVVIEADPPSPFNYERINVTVTVTDLPVGVESISLYRNGTDPEDRVGGCVISGSPTTTECAVQLSAQARGVHTLYAIVTGVDDSDYQAELELTVQAVTTNNRIHLSRIKVSEVSEVELSYTLDGTTQEPLIVTFPVEFQVLSAFTDIPGCASNPGFTASTLTVDVSGCSGTLEFSGATVVNPPDAGTYIIRWTDDEGEGAVIILEADGITITASVDPYLTFDVGAQDEGVPCDGTFSSSDYVLALGTLNSATVTSSDSGGVQHICTHLWTNATNGAVVTVKSLNAGLASVSVPADVIPSATGAVTAGTPRYGICFGTDTGDSGTDVTVPVGAAPTAAAPFNVTCTPAAHNVGQLTTGSQTIWSVNNPTQNAFAKLYVKAAISGTSPAHSDYSDLLTFVATGTF